MSPESALEHLLQLNAQLRAELTLAEDSSQIVVLDQSAQGRLSHMDAMQQQAMGEQHVQSIQRNLRKVETAITRCHAGSCGVCCRCGEEIDAQRLAHDPAAPYCAVCCIHAA